MISIQTNNEIYTTYTKELGSELNPDWDLEEILSYHNNFSIEKHLRLNFLLHSCLSKKFNRLKVEEDSYSLIYSTSDSELNFDIEQYLKFKKFCSDASRINYRLAQLNRPEEIQLKMANSNRGKKRTIQSRKKMSESHKGKAFRSGFHLTEETKEKLRQANLGKKQSEATKEKRKESLHKLRWWNNGLIQVRSEYCPEGDNWVLGRLPNQLSEEARQKCSQEGKKWYNNGFKNIMAFECPEGFVKGRCKTSEKNKTKLDKDNKECE